MYSFCKHFIFFLLCLLLASGAMAQSTTVSGQVVDTGAQQWKNGTFQFIFIPNRNTPDFSRYSWTGGALVPTIAGVLDNTGSYSISVPTSSTVTPTGSQWKLQVCSGTTPTNCFTQVQPTVGGSQTISPTPPSITISPGAGNSAYADVEVQPAILGSLYFNLTLLAYRNCTVVSGGVCVTWATVGGTGGGPSTGVSTAVQTADGVGGFVAGGARDTGTVFNTNTDDLQDCGPNLHFDIRCFGASTSTGTGTCSITSGTSTLTCGANDFLNGNGVLVNQAGSATILTNPGQPTVTPYALLNGATTYTYRVIAEDHAGGLTAAGVAGSTTTGATSLGPNSITLTNCSIVSGLATYTSSGNHNLGVGAWIDIENFTGGFANACDGVVTVNSTPTGTTFTVVKAGAPDSSTSTGSPTAVVWACNRLTFSSYSGVGTLRYWIYRNSAIGGVAVGQDPYFEDCGLNPTVPAYVPSSPQGSPQPGYLATTVSSGGGTGSITLAANAGSTATSQSTLHDNVPNLRLAVQAAYSAGGGTVYVPAVSGLGYLFNSTADLATGFINVFSRSVRIHFNNNFSSINGTWIPHTSMEIDGEPHQTTAFNYINGVVLGGTANPMFYLGESPSGGASVHFSRLFLNFGGLLQTGILLDTASDGGSTVGDTFDDVFVSNTNHANAIITKGGFDFYYNRGGITVQAGSFSPYVALKHTVGSGALTSTGQITGRLEVNGTFFSGSGVEYNCTPSVTFNLPVRDSRYFRSLLENPVNPFMKITGCGGDIGQSFQIRNLNISDNIAACTTPVVDATDSIGFVRDFTVENILTFCGSPAALALPPGNTSLVLVYGSVTNAGNASSINVITPFGLFGTFSGKVFEPLSFSASPSLAVSAGGAVPIGTIPYTVSAVDIDGQESFVGPVANAVTSGGNQTVTVTRPALPAGAVSWFVQRQGVRANIGVITGNCNTPIPSSFTQYVDTVSFNCGVVNLQSSTAGTTILGLNGLSSPTFRIMNSGFYSGSNFPNPLTAIRNLVVPDANSVLMIIGGFTTTAAASDNVSLQGVTTSSHCGLTATNSTAATDSTSTFVSAVSANQVTVTHPANSGRTWNLFCSPN